MKMKIETNDCLLTITPEGVYERKTIEKKTKLAMDKFGVSSRVARIYAAVSICSEIWSDIRVEPRQVIYQDRSFSIYPRALDGTSYPEVVVCP